MKVWFVAIGMIVLLLGFTDSAKAGGWLFYHDGPYEGQVLDDETGEPIEEVAVVAVWDLDPGFPFGGHGSIFFDAQESVTDKEGKFKIESKVGFNPWPFASMKRPVFSIYKPGFDSYPPVLPILPNNPTIDDRQQANDYRSKHRPEITKDKYNILTLSKTKNDDERLYVMSHQMLPISNKSKNIKILYSYRDSEYNSLKQNK